MSGLPESLGFILIIVWPKKCGDQFKSLGNFSLHPKIRFQLSSFCGSNIWSSILVKEERNTSWSSTPSFCRSLLYCFLFMHNVRSVLCLYPLPDNIHLGTFSRSEAVRLRDQKGWDLNETTEKVDNWVVSQLGQIVLQLKQKLVLLHWMTSEGYFN